MDDWNEQELCGIYNRLNQWEWPTILGDEPEWWSKIAMHYGKNTIERETMDSKYDIMHPVMELITNKVGEKELLRYHWLNNLEKSNEQFEEWYVNGMPMD